jgi:hypothetical protein
MDLDPSINKQRKQNKKKHFCSVADPESGAFLTPGSGMENIQIRVFDADAGSCQPWIQYGKNRIRDNRPRPQHCNFVTS